MTKENRLTVFLRPYNVFQMRKAMKVTFKKIMTIMMGVLNGISEPDFRGKSGPHVECSCLIVTI